MKTGKEKAPDLDEVIERYDVLSACLAGAVGILKEYSTPGDSIERIECGLETARREFERVLLPLLGVRGG